MKRLLLIVGIVTAFFIGYGAAAKAYPGGGIYGRGEYRGYFTNALDYAGVEVLNVYCTGAYAYFNGHTNCNAIPNTVNDADSFIAFIEDRLANGAPGGTFGDTRARTGAAFIVQTMIGSSRNRPPTAAEMDIWRDQVRQYGAGHVNWNTSAYSFNINTFFEGTDASPSPNDDAFYDHNSSGATIIFYNDSGIPMYNLRRECGNPVGNGTISPLPLRSNFNVTGHSVLDYGTVAPGGTVNFWHYLYNEGPTSAPSEYWVTLEGPSSTSPTGLPNSNGGPISIGADTEVYVKGEVFTVPLGAPGGTIYCRMVGWDPIDSEGGRDGRGAETCVTVFIPAKIRAGMTANPTNAVNGDTITFTGSISTLSSGNPVTVNCTITRAVVPSSGPSTGLGSQPCVDTTGNPNINVPTGGSVTLRPNTYVVADSVAVGSRVCDTITITSPSDPSYFNAAADRTATSCTTIGKTPYVRFMGNDIWAGGGFAAINPTCNTSAKITTVGRTLVSGAKAGSVGEYNVFALGQVTSFGSTGRVLNGTGAIGDAARSLTFANSNPSSAVLGNFGSTVHCINDYVAQYNGATTVAGNQSYDVSTRPNGAWHLTGNLTLKGTMPTGGLQVYLVDGDVTIGDSSGAPDLRYPSSYANVNQIPSLLVISKRNMYVMASVRQMDGNFVVQGNGTASGVFYTCWPRTEPASISNVCNTNQLVVNGAVAAARLDLFRTNGATGATDAARQSPAELFNFSTEQYLRNVLGTSSGATIRTTTVLDLPPRF